MRQSLNHIDKSISRYCKHRNERSFVKMYKAILDGTVLVPTGSDVQEEAAGALDVPVVCVRHQDGQVQMPIFTSLAHLYAWKVEGSDHIELSGRKAVALACNIQGIDEIVINISDAPTGRIPRVDFLPMLDL